MSHQSQLDFVGRVKAKFPDYFVNKKVLEIGSLDINGSIRQFFDNCTYIGVDIGEGRGVDVVARGEKLVFPTGYFDVTASCECFEHNDAWAETFDNMVRMSNGLVFFSCATTGRPEHGTGRTSRADNPFLGDYYLNLTEQDFRDKCDLSKFEQYEFSTCDSPADLYFWGLCKQS